jgi:hypothetical protein
MKMHRKGYRNGREKASMKGAVVERVPLLLITSR